MNSAFENKIFDPSQDFNALALELFHFQYKGCQIYKEYVDNLNINPTDIHHYLDIPFLPISFFKSHTINCKEGFQLLFESSGTTGEDTSQHCVASKNLYEQSIYNGFHTFLGNPQGTTFLALLPGYLERKNASLVYMMDYLIKESQEPLSGFYLQDYARLKNTITSLNKAGKRYVLFGVSHALLDFIEQMGPISLHNALVFETGGMKGKRPELPKEALHTLLKKGFKVQDIYSEYGMTELLSQSYLMGDGLFHSPSWKKVLARPITDPLSTEETGRNVGLNVIDLANMYSCSFIATEDLGTITEDGFQVQGRIENTVTRGCNMLFE